MLSTPDFPACSTSTAFLANINDSTTNKIRPTEIQTWLVALDLAGPGGFAFNLAGTLLTSDQLLRLSEIVPCSHLAESGYSLPSGPEITHEAEIIEEFGAYQPWIAEVIDAALASASQHEVNVARVKVSKFTSMEDANYKECVITFYSPSNWQKLIDFSPVLADILDDWRQNQFDFVRTGIANLLSIEIRPMEFWKDVRP
jgi:hypothetical protein